MDILTDKTIAMVYQFLEDLVTVTATGMVKHSSVIPWRTLPKLQPMYHVTGVLHTGITQPCTLL